MVWGAQERDMDFMGIGAMELLLILVVAFIFLGPNKMVDAARTLGKIVQEFRRTTSELGQIDLEERPESPAVSRERGSKAPSAREPGPEESVEPVPYQSREVEFSTEDTKPPKEGGEAP